MEARSFRVLLLVCLFSSFGAGYQTPNFVVNAPTPKMAKQIGDAAEVYRRDLAILWLGESMPDWSKPCPISAEVSPNLGAGGATSFQFHRGEVFGWTMSIQGSLERILDSVLPHEVTHTIFASYFRQPLPRWADEGACSTVEHAEERSKLEHMLVRFLKTDKGIPFSRMFKMKEYPADMLPLYSQGYALAEYLIADGGRRKFIKFIEDGLTDEDWPRAVREYYGHDNLLALQNTWLDWVRDGRPLPGDDGPRNPDVWQVAATESSRPLSASGAPADLPWVEPSGSVYRGQSPDPPGETGELIPVPPRSAPVSSPTITALPRVERLNPIPQRAGEVYQVSFDDPLASEPPGSPGIAPVSLPPVASPNSQPQHREVVLHWVRSDAGYVKK